MVFEAEKQIYELHREEWLKKGLSGHFVVIKGDKVLGTFATFTEAYTSGAAAFGDKFFVRAISAGDDVQIIQRVYW